MGSTSNFRRVTASTSFLWCFLALILTSKFEFGSCEDQFIIEDPTFNWDGFRLNIEYQISDSIVAERVTHDIVSDEDCLGGIIDEEEIESEVFDVSENRVRISLLMNPESIHASRYVNHYDDYAIIGICARLWVNKPINNEFEPRTGQRDDYMLIKADLEDLKGIEEILDDKAKNWGVDVYRCDYNNNRQTNPPAIRNGEKLRLCLEPTQRTIDEGVFMGTIKSFHFERDGVLQKSVATYGTDEFTQVFDCHRGSNKCALETILKNDFFFAPGEVKAEGLIYLQWGYEDDRKRNLRSVPVKINADLDLQQHKDRSLYEWYEKGEIISEKSGITMVKVEPMDKVYKAEAFACDENNNPNQKTSMNETDVTRICIKPDKEAREAGIYINSLEAFEFGLANDDKTQIAIDSFGVVADDNKTIVECSPGADVCSLESKLRSWFFDEDAPMVASGYVVLQFGSFSQTRRRAQISGYGDEFAGRDQVETYFDTVGRGPGKERNRPVKRWFEDLFDEYDLSETHVTILYIVAIVLFILILLCCLAGCLFFFWYGRGDTKQQPEGRAQHIDIKINQQGKEISQGKETSQSDFQDERSNREGSRSNTEDDYNALYSPYSPSPSRRGSNRGGSQSNTGDDYSSLYAPYSPGASRRGSNRGGSQSNTGEDDVNSYRSNTAARRGSNGGSQPRRGSNNGGQRPRRGSNDGDKSQSRRGSERGGRSRRGSNRGSASNTEDDDVNTHYSTGASRRGSERGGRSRRGSNRGSASNTEEDDVNTLYSTGASRRGSERGGRSRRGSNEGSVSRRGSNNGRRGSNKA